MSKGLGLLRGESCAEVVGSASGHGGITGAELCQMTLSDLASNLAAGFSVGGASLSYTPPSGYTYVANVVTTTTAAELRTRIANAPLKGCEFYMAGGITTYDENLWYIHCGNPTVIFLDQGTFLLGGTQARGLARPSPRRAPLHLVHS